MKPRLHLLLFVSAAAFCPFSLVVPPLAAAPAATQPALSSRQLDQGFRAGFKEIVTQAIVPGAIEVPLPSVARKAKPGLIEKKNGAVVTAFEKALAETVSKVLSETADLIKEALESVEIENPETLLSGSSNAGSKFLSKAIGSSVRDKLKPLVKRAAAATDLAEKGRAVLDAINPNGVKGGASMIVDLEDHVCKQVIAQSFKLMEKTEKAVRANPDLLKRNALAQKVFSQYRK